MAFYNILKGLTKVAGLYIIMKRKMIQRIEQRDCKVKDIVASLKYGRVWSRQLLLFCDLYIFICGFCLSYTFVYLFDPSRSLEEFFVMFSVSLFLTGIGLYVIIKNMLLRKRIKVWLQDAILLKAFVWKVAERYSRSWFPNLKIKIQFFHENNFIFRCSGTKESNGYDTVFYQFIDKEIDILYSPKYDEVMLLKLKKE